MSNSTPNSICPNPWSPDIKVISVFLNSSLALVSVGMDMPSTVSVKKCLKNTQDAYWVRNTILNTFNCITNALNNTHLQFLVNSIQGFPFVFSDCYSTQLNHLCKFFNSFFPCRDTMYPLSPIQDFLDRKLFLTIFCATAWQW